MASNPQQFLLLINIISSEHVSNSFTRTFSLVLKVSLYLVCLYKMVLLNLGIAMLFFAFPVTYTSEQACFTNDLLPELGNFSRVYPLVSESNLLSIIPLYFGLMGQSEDSDYLNSTVTAVQLALDKINADSNLLKGYSLHYTLTISQVRNSRLTCMFSQIRQ